MGSSYSCTPCKFNPSNDNNISYAQLRALFEEFKNKEDRQPPAEPPVVPANDVVQPPAPVEVVVQPPVPAQPPVVPPPVPVQPINCV